MEKLLSSVGSLLYGMRFTMLFFYVGLFTIIIGILGGLLGSWLFPQLGIVIGKGLLVAGLAMVFGR